MVLPVMSDPVFDRTGNRGCTGSFDSKPSEVLASTPSSRTQNDMCLRRDSLPTPLVLRTEILEVFVGYVGDRGVCR